MITIPFFLEVEEFCRPEAVYRLLCRWYSTVRDIKNQLNSLTNQPLSRLHLFHSSRPYELSNSITLHDLGIDKEGYSMKLAIDHTSDHKFTLEVVSNSVLDEKTRKTIQDVRLGLDCNKIPYKTDILDSTGGVYFMRSCKGAKVAVFKPRDEEQGMENNPKGYGIGAGSLRKYFTPGYGCLRELAAYIFDVGNFCSVPPTTLVHCEHPVLNYPNKSRIGTSGKPFPKLGSLQNYIHGESFEDIGASKLSDFEVQKIALLDLRILNCDRNSCNILAVRKLQTSSRRNSDVGTEDTPANTDDEFDCFDPNLNVEGGIDFELVPIDHGYAFPPHLLINDYDWSWFYYPQVSRPVVPEIREYMATLDIDTALAKIREHVVEIPEETLFLVHLAHLLIKEGIAAGLTLKDIATLVARMDEDEPSKLERVIATAGDNALTNIQMKSERSSKRTGEFTTFSPALKRLSSNGLVSMALGTLPDRDRSDSSGSSDVEVEQVDPADGNALRRLASVMSPKEFNTHSPVSIVRETSISQHSSSGSLNEQETPAAKSTVKADLAPPRQGSNFLRVASFAGFDSASIYDAGKQNSIVESTLHRERRKIIARTEEFKNLKWKLASEGVRAMIGRTKSKKIV